VASFRESVSKAWSVTNGEREDHLNRADPWPRLGGRRRGLGLERWRGGRRTLGWCGGSTGLAGLAGLAFFQPLHRRNPERLSAGKRGAVALLSQLGRKRVHHGNLLREHPYLYRHLHVVA